MLFALAVIPVIVLLIIIYVKDKKEKEPIGLLIGLFFAGMSTVIPAFIAEVIGELIMNLIIPYDSVIKAVLIAALLVGPVEEMGKYIVLRKITWRSKHFDYSYDAIVYGVFTSLGFAAIENVGYVFTNGLGTAILRMFTAVPGHACFGVFMGFFFSKAKYAEITNNRQDYKTYNRLSVVVPMLLHGIYDAFPMGAAASGELVLAGLGILLWIVYVLVLFAVSCIIIVKSSQNDFCIVSLPGAVQTFYRPAVIGVWNCACGRVNQLNFCSTCGRPRPMVNGWTCPRCGTLSALNFCGNCGYRAM